MNLIIMSIFVDRKYDLCLHSPIMKNRALEEFDDARVSSILLVDGRVKKPQYAVLFRDVAENLDAIMCGHLTAMRFQDNTAAEPRRVEELFRIAFEDDAFSFEGFEGLPTVQLVRDCLRICGYEGDIGAQNHSTLYDEDGGISELPVTIMSI